MSKLKLFYNPSMIEAGVDEAGRGSLIGPVFASAVILPPNFKNEFLDDSKKISEKKRDELRIVIEKEAIAWSVAQINHEIIDKVNILNATYLAMHDAIKNLKIKPELLLIDGNRFKVYKGIPHICQVKGDGKFASIAAASILAKTHRDEFIKKIHLEFPQYNWDKNKGYGTANHKEMYEKYGPSIYQRKTFQYKPKQIEIDFSE